MLKNCLYIIGSLIIVGFLSACGPPSDNEAPVSFGQPAVSVSQRQGSILTPTVEGDQAAAAETLDEPIAENSSSPTETVVPLGTLSDQIETAASPNETLNSSSTTVSTQPIVTNQSVPHTEEPIPATPTKDDSNLLCDPGASSAFEAEVIVLINAERGNNGIEALLIHSQLTTAARDHSDDMACNKFFSHESPTSGSPFDRIVLAGYSYSWAGENIAAGYTTPADLVEGWMNSEGHRENILNPNFTQVGIGYAYWAGSDFGAYWTAVFASP